MSWTRWVPRPKGCPDRWGSGLGGENPAPAYCRRVAGCWIAKYTRLAGGPHMAIVDMLDTGNTLDISEELLISADSHVTEPGDLWQANLPASMKDDAPVFADRRRENTAGQIGR